jgi:hypothetical protein
MDATFFSEKPFNFHWTTWRYFAEDIIFLTTVGRTSNPAGI